MTAKKPLTRCPCCGQTVADPVGFPPKVHLGAMQQRLVAILRRAPDGLTVQDTCDMLYSNGRGDRSPHIIAVMARQINRKIEPLGLRIRGTGGPGSVYRLLRVERQ